MHFNQISSVTLLFVYTNLKAFLDKKSINAQRSASYWPCSEKESKFFLPKKEVYSLRIAVSALYLQTDFCEEQLFIKPLPICRADMMNLRIYTVATLGSAPKFGF